MCFFFKLRLTDCNNITTEKRILALRVKVEDVFVIKIIIFIFQYSQFGLHTSCQISLLFSKVLSTYLLTKVKKETKGL